jgi:hypothetical protein
MAAALLLTAFMVLTMPYAFIWALNTLFGLHIELTFWNWAAALVLIALMQGNHK